VASAFGGGRDEGSDSQQAANFTWERKSGPVALGHLSIATTGTGQNGASVHRASTRRVVDSSAWVAGSDSAGRVRVRLRRADRNRAQRSSAVIRLSTCAWSGQARACTKLEWLPQTLPLSGARPRKWLPKQIQAIEPARSAPARGHSHASRYSANSTDAGEPTPLDARRRLQRPSLLEVLAVNTSRRVDSRGLRRIRGSFALYLDP